MIKACTAFDLDDCPPGAFKANDHIARIIKHERQKTTTESGYTSIDWEHFHNFTDLHFVRVRADFNATPNTPIN
jgi:hypothetical protein